MNLSTFSIVARDTKTGSLAVAGGTNWFCYGRWVPNAEAGVGVVATQAETNIWYAPNSLIDMKKGMNAQETVKDLLERDADSDGVYQLLVMDSNGNTACHTGHACHDYAGNVCEENLGVAGNTLVSEETLTAMVDYYRMSKEPFVLRIIKTLQSGQMAGGDIRGMKSAAIKVVKSTNSGKYWEDTKVDLRVDESSDPLKELERLYYVDQAYNYLDIAETISDQEERIYNYQKALEDDPGNNEIMFWLARTYREVGRDDEAEDLRQMLRDVSRNWDEYWKRLDKR